MQIRAILVPKRPPLSFMAQPEMGPIRLSFAIAHVGPAPNRDGLWWIIEPPYPYELWIQNLDKVKHQIRRYDLPVIYMDWRRFSLMDIIYIKFQKKDLERVKCNRRLM